MRYRRTIRLQAVALSAPEGLSLTVIFAAAVAAADAVAVEDAAAVEAVRAREALLEDCALAMLVAAAASTRLLRKEACILKPHSISQSYFSHRRDVPVHLIHGEPRRHGFIARSRTEAKVRPKSTSCGKRMSQFERLLALRNVGWSIRRSKIHLTG